VTFAAAFLTPCLEMFPGLLGASLASREPSIGAAVITNNPGDFTVVPGLRVENWTE
jgi:hypothetical protein